MKKTNILTEKLLDSGWNNIFHLLDLVYRESPGISDKRLIALGKTLGVPIDADRISGYRRSKAAGTLSSKFSQYARSPRRQDPVGKTVTQPRKSVKLPPETEALLGCIFASMGTVQARALLDGVAAKITPTRLTA